jgi:hypothetical protein
MQYTGEAEGKRHGNKKAGSLTTKLGDLDSLNSNQKPFNSLEAVIGSTGSLSAIAVSGKGIPKQYLWYSQLNTSSFTKLQKNKNFGTLTASKDEKKCTFDKTQLVGFATTTAKVSGPIKSI